MPSIRLAILLTLAFVCCVSSQARQENTNTVRISIEPEVVIGHIAPDFLGFGYETSAVAQSNFFSPRNEVMVQLYKNLSPQGLIRIGGIISDHTQFVPDGVPAAHTLREVTIINQANLVDLGDFARATGWKVMWGLNLGTGSKEEAVKEAVAVAAALGTNLQSFQIGNEVEDLRRFARNYNAYHSNYVDYKAAIRAALPNSPFSGPDSVGILSWVTNFVAQESSDIKLITHHYYRGGAGEARTSLARLLQHDDAWDTRLEKLREISQSSGIPYRINEVNSFSGGGKPGVSDTFGATLWCLDYLYILASHGCEGINVETDINQLGFISHYSPIVHDAMGTCSERPEYYAMLAFALSGNGELVKLDLGKPEINLAAYATKASNGNLWLTIINKDFERDASVEAKTPDGYSNPEAARLSAPSMESKDHVMLADAEVTTAGTWKPGPFAAVHVKNNLALISVPHASAIILQFHRD